MINLDKMTTVTITIDEQEHQVYLSDFMVALLNVTILTSKDDGYKATSLGQLIIEYLDKSKIIPKKVKSLDSS